ncbi:acyl-CoA dehydrogenase family protein [Nocardioides litoris]|uniref:acyl-CoA dehydrogenase family protein n=1 Tax=Nocardioides litoris TaxID=1926648 RepID=UPI00111CE65C|nr:acyl-CoA dehydrogenase family protein [Nocardioides litoris]
MRFELDDDQRDFAASLDALLAAADTVGAARAWAAGDRGPGTTLAQRLAGQGVLQLALEATPVEVVVAFEALGRYAVPGPWVASAAYLPVVRGTELEGLEDLDGAPPTREDHPEAFDLAVLANAAQLLGAGERVLADSVAYVKQRRQFGREIGSYQAIKHRLADVRIALDFARPLVLGAALGAVPASAAKVQAADAAYLASRSGLQVHGAIGYTAELDLSLWLVGIRAMVSAWGTPAAHRARLLDALLHDRVEGRTG